MDLLQKIGLSADQVGRLASRMTPKGSCGRRGLSAAVVNQMWADYQRLKSLAKVGKLHGRSRQSMYQILHKRFELNHKVFQKAVEYKGQKFTPGKGGYLRCTIFRRGRKDGEAQLHRIMWVDLYGPIPEGWQVSFKDGNKRNCTPENLFCAPKAEVSLFHYRRHFGERAALSPEQRKEWWRAFYRRYWQQKRDRFIAQGLRSDGKPRRRGRKETEPWEFHYFPPVVVREDRNMKVTRRPVFSTLGRSELDVLYAQMRGEMEAERPKSIYA